MEGSKKKNIRKKKPVDVVLIRTLVEQSGVAIYRIEKETGMGRGLLLRGLQENPKVRIPPKWEHTLIKYLNKKIVEKKDAEIQTTEVLQELGFKIPEQESNLKEEMKEIKRTWVGNLQG